MYQKNKYGKRLISHVPTTLSIYQDPVREWSRISNISAPLLRLQKPRNFIFVGEVESLGSLKIQMFRVKKGGSMANSAYLLLNFENMDRHRRSQLFSGVHARLENAVSILLWRFERPLPPGRWNAVRQNQNYIPLLFKVFLRKPDRFWKCYVGSSVSVLEVTTNTVTKPPVSSHSVQTSWFQTRNLFQICDISPDLRDGKLPS